MEPLSNGGKREPQAGLRKKSLIQRFTSHLDWNEAIVVGTNTPQGRTWINVAEVVLNAWCAGYYQAYCHQKYGIFPGTMTGNSWSAIRETEKDPIVYKAIIFKLSAIICWFVGNFVGMEIMRNMTTSRAVFLKWFDLGTVLIVAALETWAFSDENSFSNPVKNLMMVISFGSGMSTVYFRLIYGVVTNRLTGNVYRLARGAQDLAHGTNDCPNAALTLGICVFFLYGLYCFYAPWAADIGLFLPALVTASWEFLETLIECSMDDGLIHEDGAMQAQENENEKLQLLVENFQLEIDDRKKRIDLLTRIMNDPDDAEAKTALAILDDDFE